MKNNVNMCPKCKSTNLVYQPINEVHLKNKHRGCLWWICFGWISWLAIFIPHRKKTVNKVKTMCVCQNCGNTWNVK